MTVTGRGAIARDGCPVEVYRRLPVGDEPAVVHAVAGGRGSVLDLGAGVGRVADPLVALGHRVVAVDESAEMLGHVRRATTVLSGIEELRLDERFDVVLLASHLINVADASTRHGLLATIAHHLARDGRALVEWHPPEWFDGLEVGRTYSGRIGEMDSELQVDSFVGDLLAATVRYRSDRDVWSQDFLARRLTPTELADGLGAVGLDLIGHDGLASDWLVARRRRP